MSLVLLPSEPVIVSSSMLLMVYSFCVIIVLPTLCAAIWVCVSGREWFAKTIRGEVVRFPFLSATVLLLGIACMAAFFATTFAASPVKLLNDEDTKQGRYLVGSVRHAQEIPGDNSGRKYLTLHLNESEAIWEPNSDRSVELESEDAFDLAVKKDLCVKVEPLERTWIQELTLSQLPRPKGRGLLL